MKKTVLIVLFSLLAIAMGATEISKSSTGAVLDESGGVYSIRTKTGILPLGDISAACDFFFTANICFVKKNLKIL